MLLCGLASSACTQTNPMDALYRSQTNFQSNSQSELRKGPISINELLNKVRLRPAAAKTPLAGSSAGLDLKLILQPQAQQLSSEQALSVKAQLQNRFKDQKTLVRIAAGPGIRGRNVNAAQISVRRIKNIAQQIRLPGQNIKISYNPRLKIGEININARLIFAKSGG
jgi:hypothetical protein